MHIIKTLFSLSYSSSSNINIKWYRFHWNSLNNARCTGFHTTLHLQKVALYRYKKMWVQEMVKYKRTVKWLQLIVYLTQPVYLFPVKYKQKVNWYLPEFLWRLWRIPGSPEVPGNVTDSEEPGLFPKSLHCTTVSIMQ